MDTAYSFTAPLWEYGGEASWVFITVPVAESDEIAELAPTRPGFGSVRVMVTIGGTQWLTSLFPSKELAAYVLPVKRAVRVGESLDIGDVADVTIRVVLD
jgi:hypothetical protein